MARPLRIHEFVEEKIGREARSPLKEVVCSTILGSMEFAKAVSKEHLEDKKPDGEVPALRKLSGQLSIAVIEKAAEELFRKEGKKQRPGKRLVSISVTVTAE